MTTYNTPIAFQIYSFKSGAAGFLERITEKLMGAQSHNGFYAKHAIRILPTVDGNPINGKLSDFKTKHTAHLWVGDD